MRLNVIVLTASLAAACISGTPTAPDPVADVNTFSSSVAPGSAASRQFDVTTGGTVSVRLSSTNPDGVVLGLGVGIPRSNGSCAVSSAVDTPAGAEAQLAVTTGAGAYCARVHDPGTLSAPVSFTLVISRP
jgi:hypothetical protein